MNAFECLEAYRKAAGFDGWVLPSGRPAMGKYKVVSLLARPAWRLPDGSWYVLPPEWEWDGDKGAFINGEAWVGPLLNGFRARLTVQHGFPGKHISHVFATAPEAFNAAMKWMEGQGASDD